ncbi:MAG: hypothetical protein ACRENN_03090 [Candidatus Eiseniibacteriota bacterium]
MKNHPRLALSSAVRCCFSLLLVGLAGPFLPNQAQAVPAYARRYDTKCETCHAPVPPRLNNTGEVFRRWGFRLPDADENGKLTMKVVPAHSISDAASIVAEFAAHQDQYVSPGESKSTLEMGEVAVVAGTSIGEKLSTQAIFIPHNDEGGVELENAQLQYNHGTASHNFSLRAGLIEPFRWMKGTHGTLTPTGTLAFSESPLIPVGNFPGFSLGLNQVEVEAGYTYSKLRNGKMWTTLLSAAVLNGVDEAGETASRNTTDGMDVFLQAIELFGARNTLGGFYYKGRTLIDPFSTLLPPGPFKDKFTRYGVMGNYVLFARVDLVGALADGKDDSDELTGNVVSRGAYGQVDVTIRDRWVADYRRDYLDPDRNVGDDLIRAHVVATTYQAEDNLFFTAEYQETDDNGAKSHGITGMIRLVY